ncbi:gluconokinase [Azospirillum sp. sgz301742]
MIVVVMGVSGCGKSTIGQLLADRLGCPFSDADAFHPPGNIDKMSRGMALTDEDRWPWLRAIRAAIVTAIARGEDHVLACSALKESYRRVLSEGDDVLFVHLTGDPALIRERLAARRGHFFDPALLQNQFDTLETPSDAIVVDIALGPDRIVEELMRALRPQNMENTP